MASFEQVIDRAIDVAVKRAMLAAHPVGSYLITENQENPSGYIGGGWTLVSDKVLIGAGGKYTAGQEIGAESVSYTPAGTVGGTAITVDQMPSHDHSASTDTKGAHTHGRGTTEITGSLGSSYIGGASSVSTGALSTTIGKERAIGTGNTVNYKTIEFTASMGWSGATDSKGGHAHTITVGNKGGGKTHAHGFTGTAASISTLQPARAVFLWRRTS